MKPWPLKSVKSYHWDLRPGRRGPPARLLITVTNENRADTLRHLTGGLAERGIRHERWRYSRLLNSRRLPRAVYILTDFDRLMPWHVELASRLYCRLTAEGVTVLNDPRRHVPRWAFLRRLRREGINDFDCWLPAEGVMPDRYPVFLRTIHAHRGVESGLLRNETEARSALQTAMDRGLVLSDLVFIEYAAEPNPETGKFRKYAAYGIGDRVVRALTVTDESWIAKQGTKGAATDANYASDLIEHRMYPRAELMRQVFDIAGMDFGRIDYGIIAGRPQVYELNTNPLIRWGKRHPNPDRRTADDLVRGQLLDNLAELCRPEQGRMINVADAIPRSLEARANFKQP